VKVLLRWRRSKDEFEYPGGVVPRTAVLVPWFRERTHRGAVRVFKGGWSEEAALFAPEAIAATWRQLKELAGATQRATARPAPTHAVIVLHRVGRPPLSAADREWLWRKFGVPVFEQMIGARGELLAAECEAHDGMHVASAQPSRRLMAPGQMETAVCGCGHSTPRLKAAGAVVIRPQIQGAPVHPGRSVVS
jgi:hypothetical protein